MMKIIIKTSVEYVVAAAAVIIIIINAMFIGWHPFINFKPIINYWRLMYFITNIIIIIIIKNNYFKIMANLENYVVVYLSKLIL